MSLAELLLRGVVASREPAAAAKEEEYNAIVRQRVSDTVDALNLVLPGELFTEDRLANNASLLAPGEHGGAVFTRPSTDLWGAGPRAIIAKRVVFERSAVVDGIHFSTTETADGKDECATVRVGAVVVFRGCTFERPLDSTSSMVVVDTGAKVTLLGCVFRGSGTTVAPVVQHSVGPAPPDTDVQIAFCYNQTGNTLATAGSAIETGNH